MTKPQMAQAKDQSRLVTMLHWLRPIGVAGVLLFCFMSIILLADNVWRELVALEKLSSDNTQWSLMQTEVEMLRLELSVKQAIAGGEGGDLADVRRWFDVVYSRVNMLSESEAYAAKLILPDYASDAQQLRAFLDGTVPLIDGSAEELRRSLGMLADKLEDVRRSARQLTLTARAESAIESDDHRQAVKSTLLQLAILTALLLVLLSGLALVSVRLMRRSRTQMRQSALTSARLQTIFATSADAIIVTNRGGWIVDINPAAEAMFGHMRPKSIGVHALELLLPPEIAASQSTEIAAILEASAARAKDKEHGPLRIELMALRNDGTRFPVEMSLGTMQVESGGVIVALVRDISDRRIAQSALTGALQQAQAGEKTKADFIAVMSHEMRTPLNGLLGSLELLAATDLSGGQKDLVGVMAASGQILLHHVNSVLEISKAEANRGADVQTVFDLDGLIDDCVANQGGLAATKGLSISVRTPGGPVGYVRGDPARLRQILLNLIGNAVKFTLVGGIMIEQERLGENQSVEIRVIDTGVGIPEGDLERVFDDFVTLDARYDRQAGGTGLGLGIARRVTQTMGGEIGVESVLGDGSVFWLRLPLPHVERCQTNAKDLATDRQILKVLVIEDNPVNRFVLRRLLEESGHIVHEAINGATGLAAAMTETFDLIMTDISMPGMDGVEVTRQIRLNAGPSQHARIIAVTAHALPADLARFRAAGVDDCMIKPITRVTLTTALNDPPAWTALQGSDVVLDHAQVFDMASRLGASATAALIGRAIAEGDGADADELWAAGVTGEQRLHALAGTAGTFGAKGLQTRIADLSVACAAGNTEEMARLAAGLPQIWHLTRAALSAAALQLQSDYPLNVSVA